MLKKNLRGYPRRKKLQLKNENEKYWKLLDLSRKVEKNGSKNLTAATGKKKKSKKNKKWMNTSGVSTFLAKLHTEEKEQVLIIFSQHQTARLLVLLASISPQCLGTLLLLWVIVQMLETLHLQTGFTEK